MSFVGRPAGDDEPSGSEEPLYLGKPGITGLAQINRRADMTPEEVEKYNLYYAKNQSLVLDCEILLKAMLNSQRM
jgi:lipopolysaccharide/colanic/teichoic acid biosynthesis glycosyltransferase